MTTLSPLRLGRITGSRIPKVLGISLYGSRADLLREMTRQALDAPAEWDGNIATEYGQEHESDGIDAFERRTGILVHSGQEIQVHPTIDYLAATPDGLIGTDGVLEVKAPYMARYISIDERPDYQAQCQLLMEITGRRYTEFVVWRPSGASFSRLERDPEWLPSVMPQIDAFIAEYRETIADPKLAAPHLEPLVDQRLDEGWQIAAQAYLDAKADADRYAAACEEARQHLILLADGKPARGSGVHVIRSERKGSTSYAKAIKELAPGADLAPYQSAPTVVYTVRATAEGAN